MQVVRLSDLLRCLDVQSTASAIDMVRVLPYQVPAGSFREISEPYCRTNPPNYHMWKVHSTLGSTRAATRFLMGQGSVKALQAVKNYSTTKLEIQAR